ncbi:MAG: hypothetical protein GY710_06270 [Desulfobacteraceae bacterium]|nr:hypothetical protein [Desulfobacteraceae bacterium]
MAKEPLMYQRIGEGLFGYTEKDKDLILSTPEYKPFFAETRGVKNKTGASHMRLYWACCTFMVEQLGDEKYNNKYKIDTLFRHKLKFYDTEKCIVDIEKGIVVMVLMSISMKNINYILKKDYFNQAIERMSEMVDVDVKTFVDEVKSRMVGNRNHR